MKITPNFSYEELNIVGCDSIVIDNALALCNDVLEPIREKLGPLRITSGRREEDKNKLTGGVSNSQHLYKLMDAAVDFFPIEVDIHTAFDWIRKESKLKRIDQVILEYDSNGKEACIHISTKRNTVCRNEALIGGTHGTKKYIKVEFIL